MVKLIRSCQHSSFYFTLTLVLLQIFPAIAQVVFARKRSHKKVFRAPSPVHIWLYQGYCRVEAAPLSRHWKMHSSQSLTCYLSQMSYMLLDPCACAAGCQALWWQTGSGTGAGLSWRCSTRQMEALQWNVSCAQQKWEQRHLFQPLMRACVFCFSVNTFFNCFICIWKIRKEQKALRGQGKSGCASMELHSSVRQAGGLTFVWSVGKWGCYLPLLNMTRKNEKLLRPAVRLRIHYDNFTSLLDRIPSVLPQFLMFLCVYISHL